MRNALFLASLVSLTALVYACGSDGGVGTTIGGDPDAGYDSGYLPGQDGGPLPGQDGTVPDPGLDASLDVSFPDGFTVPDTGGNVDSGTLIDSGCSPPGISCTANVAYTCDKNGSLFADDCTPKNLTCADGYGCVKCIPGSGTCNGSKGTLCNSKGDGYITNDCDPNLGLTCNQGICTGDCANVGQSYIGCDYYAVTTLNHLLDQGSFPFAVAISNTTSTNATITISGGKGGSFISPQTYTVNANSLSSITLPWVKPLSCGVGPCDGNQFVQPPAPTTTLQKGGAYRIQSTEPVTVYQFNARDYTLNGLFSYTNDASMLLPVNAMTGNYYLATYPSFYQWPGLWVVAATQDNTQVTLTPSVTIVAGGGIASNGGTITMNRGDVIEVTNPVPGSVSYGNDMSGSVVSATAPVEVFGGHACVYVPASQAACDHMEEAMFPTETLRSDYFVVPPNMTGITTAKKPSHFVRIIATKNGSTFTYTPAQVGAPASLNAGQVGVFETSTPFEVTSNSSPFVVGEYMEGAENYGGGVLNGDPAMSVAVAKDQYRNAYQFTAPTNYQINWATLVAANNTVVKIDNVVVGGWKVIGATGYSSTYVQLSKNSSNHIATGNGPFGIEVYGYGSYTSYWYPGGLNLSR